MITVTGHLIAADEVEADLVRRHLPDHIRLSRAEPGCLTFNVDPTDDPLVWCLDESFTDRAAFDLWARDWQARICDLPDAPAVMARANPRRIPRNHRIEEAIAAARDGNYKPFLRLDSALRAPFDERADWVDLARAPEPDEIVRRTFCGT